METNVQNIRTVSDVKTFLTEQRKTYRNAVELLPNVKRFTTPEGISEQIEDAASWPINLCFYEIHNVTENPFTCNLTVRTLHLSKAQAQTA